MNFISFQVRKTLEDVLGLGPLNVVAQGPTEVFILLCIY